MFNDCFSSILRDLNKGMSNLIEAKMLRNSLKFVTLSLTIIAITSCATMRGPAYQLAQKDDKSFDKPLREPKDVNTEIFEYRSGDDEETQELKIIQPPAVPMNEASEEAEKIVVPKLKVTNITRQSYNNLPIPAFINEVYGNQLGLNYVIQPALQKAPDLVTLRVSGQMNEKDFYVLSTKTLMRYGVVTYMSDGVLIFDYSSDTNDDSAPILMTGNALPEVPAGNRPVFFIYPLKTVKTPQVRTILYKLFSRSGAKIEEDIERNALIISGKEQQVRSIIEATKLLDTPSMKGMSSIILQPAVNSPAELADTLTEILTKEGFAVQERSGGAPIKLLPLTSVGQLVVFASSEETLDHIVEWAKKLEKEREEDVENGLFHYQVQSTQASHIVELLNQLGVGGQNSAPSADGQRSRVSTGRYAVDEQLNTILFSGSGKDWMTALKMIKRLDRPAPSVMIEVILAEVSLEEKEESAIEWFLDRAVGAYDAVASTSGALGVTGGGLSLNFSRGDQTRAALNFLYENSRSKIRSRPRVMVKSGQEASIDVGDRVPTITSNVQSTNSSNAQVVQQVTYQDTGVLLDIKPTVHATGFVDIEISQELSEAISTSSSSINSPTIRTRNLTTTLTLRDGGSVLIGGLIRSNDGDGQVGVPVLGKLPGIGRLFRGDNMEQTRTELMVMIIPYILNSPEEAESLVDELQIERMRIINNQD